MKFNVADFETIIFDFGGVIFDINPQLTIDAFCRLGDKAGYSQIENSDLLWQIERGEINQEQLHSQICKFLKTRISMNDFYNAWNAILLEYKAERIEKIRDLGKTHKLLMLSNTNEIHYKHFSSKLFNEYGTTFSELFNEVYLSYKMGLIKPDKAIFEKVIDEQGLIPEKTLFIEDTKDQ